MIHSERETSISDFNSHTREGVTSAKILKENIKNFNSHTREGVTQKLTKKYMKR